MTEQVDTNLENKEIDCSDKDDNNKIQNISIIDLENSNINCERNSLTSNSSSGNENYEDDANDSDIDGKHEGIRLKKNLKSRHISMIAIGGSLGTGLLIGTGRALKVAGPVSTLIAYSVVGIVVFFTMSCLGEMATYIPLDGFTSYASRYCDPALGFAVGYAYMIKYFILPPNQLTAAALVIQYWIVADVVNPGVWITIVLVIITLINLFNVRLFGELEFWLSLIKIIIMIGLIIFLFVIVLGANSTHERWGFRYWIHPGAFKNYSETMPAPLGKFVAFIAVLIFGVFAYLGIELTGIVAAEASNPRESIPKAIKLTLYRIIVFYMVTIFLVGLCVPYNDPRLLDTNKDNNSVAASPFLIAVINSGVRVLPNIFNGCILIFVFSAANSDLYVSSRNLYSLAIDHKAPHFLAKTNRYGIPYYSLFVSVLFCLLAYMSVSSGSAKVFNYFVNVVSIVGILTWISILITYICFDKAVRAQGIDKSTFAYVSPFQPYGAYFSLVFCIIVALIKNFTVFIGGFDYESFITGYIGLPVFVLCYFGYKIVYHTKVRASKDVDLLSLRAAVDREEMEHKLMKEREKSLKPKPKGFFKISYSKLVIFLEKVI
ncbi:dicarboxylic amino acid permease [Monosporozyma servazzii]